MDLNLGAGLGGGEEGTTGEGYLTTCPTCGFSRGIVSHRRKQDEELFGSWVKSSRAFLTVSPMLSPECSVSIPAS